MRSVVEIVLAVAVFLLTIAAVGLFAMMGELSTRVPAPDQMSEVDRTLTPFEDARIGAEAPTWPVEIAHLRDADHAVVVVVSTLCETCRRVSSGGTGPLRIPSTAAAVVVSCPRHSRGAEFLDEFPLLRGYPHALDVEGRWLTDNFDVDISPCVLVFERGRLRSAHTFTTAAALLQLPTDIHHETEGIHAEK
jgi:hypothetical protein